MTDVGWVWHRSTPAKVSDLNNRASENYGITPEISTRCTQADVFGANGASIPE